ncbi:unnamed protein product, partial [Meganyctiphanes norvegica]
LLHHSVLLVQQQLRQQSSSSLTTMDQPTILRLIALLLTTAGATVQSNNVADLTCYFCSDNPNFPRYDPLCGTYDYRGETLTMVQDGCTIYIYDDGHVSRGGVYGSHIENGECNYGNDYTSCYCTGSYCNTDSYCEQCGVSPPTPRTTEHTTTEPLTTTDTTPAAATTEPLTTTFATTSESTTTLSCYHCIDCDTVDEGTTPIIEDNFLSCSTIAFLNSAAVIRGGSYDAHPDGECVITSSTVTCWCNGDLCNKHTLGF